MTTELPAEATSARASRRFVRETLKGWSCEQLTDTMELLTCELVTNALLHAASVIRLRVRRREPNLLRVEVADSSAVLPSAALHSEDAATGRGLLLVEALSAAWGVEPMVPPRTEKIVWFEMAVVEESLSADRWRTP